MNSMKRQKDMTLEDKLPSPRSLSVQYATGEKEKNSFRRNEEAEPKKKWCPVVDVSGGESKIQSFQGQYRIGTWNVRSVNQGKLEVFRQEMARVDISILGISELKWTGMGELLIQMIIISTTVGKNPLEKME